MEIKHRHTPETVTVYPLDMEKLNENINRFFHNDGQFPENITYEVRGILAFMYHPKFCLINDEFVGWDLGDKVTFHIYEEGKREDGHRWFSCIPSHEVTLPIKELEPYLKPPMTLAEFTKDRRGYNSRIKANEAEWLRYLNKV